MELLGDMGYVEHRIDVFGDGVSIGVRCTVWAPLTIGTKIILDKPEVHLGDEAQMEAHFSSFGDSANLEA
jgi:hypothetical protein